MPEYKNQHYVPQSYLKFFSNDRKNIGVYIISTQKTILSAPLSNQACEDYFYSRKNANEIETNLQELEIRGIESFRKIMNSSITEWNMLDFLDAYSFVFIQLGRTPKAAENLVEPLNDLMMQLFKIHCGGKDIDPHLVFRSSPYSLGSLAIHSSCLPFCIDLKYCFIHIKDDASDSFITSDNPVCLFNPFFESIGILDNVNLGYKGLCALMTINPKLAMIFYDPNVYKVSTRKKWIEVAESPVIETINKMIAANARTVLFFNNQYRINQRVIDIANYKFKATDYQLPTIHNGTCTLFFLKILDKSKYITKENYRFNPEFVLRKFTYFMYLHPEERQRIKKLWGSASKEDRKQILKELKRGLT